MSKLYVPDGAWLVCSDGMKKQQIKVTSQSTITIAGGHFKATIDDRPGGNFMCAKMVIAGAIVGAIVGAALVAGSVLSGGALAVAACAAAGAAAGAGVSLIPSICGILLKDWKPYDTNVLTAGKHPLIENSMIPCTLGGNVMILYSEKAADEFTDKVIAETALTVGAIVCVSYLVSGLVIAVGAAGSSVLATYAEFGLASALAQGTGMATVFGTSYLINGIYDEAKDFTGFENYVTGEAFNLNEMPANQEMGEATDKLYGAATDALGSGKDVANAQTSGYQSVTVNQSTISQNRVFVADSRGNVTSPGTTISNTTISVNNQLPNSSIGNSQSSVNASSTSVRITQSTTTATSTNVNAVQGTQYNNSLRSNASTGVKTTLGGALNGLAINFGIDLMRAASNWALASQISDLNNAMKNEEAAARAKISVIAGKD
ncbi:PAAR-like protein [Chryseobacterium wangxinyae]|uniref:PAAR-like protein n=1 Tax=Chryseobacterium sp. CY353 TaxID=2997334 RepID=UPI00226F1CAC|nr:PAAR-like protein [Chryseobacterium sp. CY353]MCY0969973.1 PAAR-like protein [Chryseobacterium sp. CY353]